MPLAIITIASLLASRPARLRKEWQDISNSLSMQVGTNPTMGGVRQILDLSYKNLPHHLRTCFLGSCPCDATGKTISNPTNHMWQNIYQMLPKNYGSRKEIKIKSSFESSRKQSKSWFAHFH